MVQNRVGLLGNSTVYVSPLVLRSLYGPVYLPVYLVFPLRYIKMSELSSRL
jgi:hypothetical protein